MASTIHITGSSNDTKLLLGSADGRIDDTNLATSASLAVLDTSVNALQTQGIALEAALEAHASSVDNQLAVLNSAVSNPRDEHPGVVLYPWNQHQSAEVLAARATLKGKQLRINAPKWSAPHMYSQATSGVKPAGAAIELSLAFQQLTECELTFDSDTWDSTEGFFELDGQVSRATDGDFNIGWKNTVNRKTAQGKYVVDTFETTSSCTVIAYLAVHQSIVDAAKADTGMLDKNGDVITNGLYRVTQALFNANKKLLSSPCAIYDELLNSTLNWDESLQIILGKAGTLGENITNPELYGPEWWAAISGSYTGSNEKVTQMMTELSAASLVPDFIYIGGNKIQYALIDETPTVSYLDPDYGNLFPELPVCVYIKKSGQYKDEILTIMKFLKNTGVMDACLIPWHKLFLLVNDFSTGENSYVDAQSAYSPTGTLIVSTETVSNVEPDVPGLLGKTHMLNYQEAALRYGPQLGVDSVTLGYKTILPTPLFV